MLETEQKRQYFDLHSYGRQRCVFLVLLMLNRRPWGPLCWVLAFFNASYQQLLWSPNSIGVPEGPLGRVWLFLPHLVYLLLQLSGTARRTQLSYIIVQRPLDRPLDIWNRMFNRHQAEKTVMQFRGHSLPVRQSMRVSWDFLACPILLANFRPRDFLSQLPLECVTSFRCITLNGILGRVEGQNITDISIQNLKLCCDNHYLLNKKMDAVQPQIRMQQQYFPTGFIRPWGRYKKTVSYIRI